jgi:hypothetical protein
MILRIKNHQKYNDKPKLSLFINFTQNVMKKNVLTLITFFLFTFYSSSQSISDQAKIIQKCVDLSELQGLYPLDDNGNPKQLVILEQYPLLFPKDLSVLKFGRLLKFAPLMEISHQYSKGYFEFKKFEIEDNSASVSFDYNYISDGNEDVLHVGLVFTLSGQDWIQSGKTIK